LIKEQKSSLPAAAAQQVQSSQDAANKALEEDLKKRQQVESNASAQVGDAVKTRNSFQVNKALTAAISVNLTGELVKEAQEFVKEEIVKDAHTQELEALIRVIKTKSQTIITEADLVPLKTAIEAARVVRIRNLFYFIVVLL
jgi:hypothetical protein